MEQPGSLMTKNLKHTKNIYLPGKKISNNIAKHKISLKKFA